MKIDKSDLGKILRFLPKREKRFLAIDFSETQTEMVYVESSLEKLKLLAYDTKRMLPQEEGKSDVIVNFIRDFLRKNSILERDIILSISEVDSIHIKYLSLPLLPREEILEAAKWQLKDDVPFDLKDASFDWQILKDYTDENGAKKRGIIFIVAKKGAIDKYLSVVAECHLNPAGITSSLFNFPGLIKHLPENPSIYSVLNIDYKDSTLAIYANSKLNFARRLPFSLQKLTDALTRVLVTAKGKVGLSREEAEEIEHTIGIPEDETQFVNKDIQGSHIMSLMRPLLEALIREIKLSYDYFSSHFDMDPPALLYLTGAALTLRNLDRYLKRGLDKDVAYLSLPSHIDTQELKDEELNQENQNRIMSVLGAAVYDSKSIDLLPLAIRRQKSESIQKTSLRVIGITAAAIFLFLLFIAQFQINDYNNRLNNAKRHLETLSHIKILKDKIDLREELIGKIQKGKVPAEGILKVLSMLMPQEIILDELILNQQSHLLIFHGKLLAGENSAETILANFMQLLEASNYFTEASLVSFKRTAMVQEFEIKCDVHYQ